MNELLAAALQKPNESVFVDSNPDIFKTILEFVRMDRKFLPKNVSNDQMEKTEIELKHWKVTQLNYDLATSINHQKVEDVYNTTPDISAEASTAALDKWKQFGPLSVQELIDKSEE